MKCCTHRITVAMCNKNDSFFLLFFSFDSMHKRKQCTHLITFLYFYIRVHSVNKIGHDFDIFCSKLLNILRLLLFHFVVYGMSKPMFSEYKLN